MRPTWADIDLSAIAHNVATLAAAADPAQLCAVVKADGYGHGAVPVARAAVDAGATWLAVALVEEGRILRDAGVRVPILLLSEPRPHEMIEVVEYGLTPTVYSGEGLAAAAAAATQKAVRLGVHLKVDTGMHRVGAKPRDAVAMAQAIVDRDSIDLEGVWTHCAVADAPDDPYTDTQLGLFDEIVASMADEGLRPPWVHAANSAVVMAHPRGRYDMVRCGIAVYGLPPSPALAGRLPLRPALRLRSQVSFVKRIEAGERVSYGRTWEAPAKTRIATVPIGYADGIRRSSGRLGGEVLIDGVRMPIVGTVTMDQLLVDCGGHDVRAGDEVVFIGAQGDDEITADEWAERLGTINYEVVCDIESRVTRRYL